MEKRPIPKSPRSDSKQNEGCCLIYVLSFGPTSSFSSVGVSPLLPHIPRPRNLLLSVTLPVASTNKGLAVKNVSKQTNARHRPVKVRDSISHQKQRSASRFHITKHALRRLPYANRKFCKWSLPLSRLNASLEQAVVIAIPQCMLHLLVQSGGSV